MEVRFPLCILNRNNLQPTPLFSLQLPFCPARQAVRQNVPIWLRLLLLQVGSASAYPVQAQNAGA